MRALKVKNRKCWGTCFWPSCLKGCLRFCSLSNIFLLLLILAGLLLKLRLDCLLLMICLCFYGFVVLLYRIFNLFYFNLTWLFVFALCSF